MRTQDADYSLLLDRARAGDREAFDKLIALNWNRVYLYALKVTKGDHDNANEIAVQSIQKAYKSLNKFLGKASFSTWMYRIVTNTFLDQKKKVAVSTISFDSIVSTNDGEELAYEFSCDASLSPQKIVERYEQEELIITLINKLPYYFREPIRMYAGGYLYEEISEELGISAGTVKSRISRAREMLNKMIVEQSTQFYFT